MKTFVKSAGFGLIESLIAVSVLSVGFLSVTKLQGNLMKGASQSNSRVVAATIAAGKLEDLHAYSTIRATVDADANGTLDPWSTTIAADNMAYNYIANNAGGTIVSGTTTVGNTVYNLNWNVTDWYFDGGTFTSTVPTPAPDFPDYKSIAINVSFSDTDGVNQTVISEGTISSVDPSAVALALEDFSPDRESPEIAFTPTSDMIFINEKATEKPEPDITQHGLVTKTTFEEITDDGNNNKQSLSDNVAINCTCVQAGEVSGQTGREPTYFDGSEEQIGSLIEKRIATKKTGGQFNEQPELCTKCCNDHHDDSSTTLLYDPFRPNNSTNYPSALGGDHSHYYPDSDGVLQTANNTNDDYLEACRFRRVDGVLYLVQDYNLETVQMLNSNFTTNQIADYITFVEDYVEAYISGISNPSSYAQSPPTPSVTFTNEPTALTKNSGEQDNLTVRGLYIDFMDSTLINLIQCKLDGSLGADCTNIPTSSDWLDFVPFHEVNITRLSNWTSSDASIATVTSEPITSSTQSTYSRGLLDTISDGDVVISATIERSNTGLTDSNPIDPDDADNVAGNGILQDQLTVTVGSGGGGTGITVAGTVSIAGGVNVNESDVIISGTNGADCTRPTDGNYSCTLDASGNGYIEVTGHVVTVVNGNTTTTQDNKACFLGNVTLTGSNTNNGDITEITTFQFIGEGSSLSFDLTIKKNNQNC